MSTFPYEPPVCEKSLWPEGPWLTEPDSASWTSHGLQCAIIRHSSLGQWCGYVQLPESHPYFGRHYNDIPVDCHGGLTYGKNGWYGFDCAHVDDMAPGLPFRTMDGTIYRDLEFVKAEVEKLAKQLAMPEILST